MAVRNKEEVLRLLRDNARELRDYGVRRFGLFGSFARETQSADSDVDLLVEFEAGQKSFDNFMRLAFFLEETFGRRVDLVTPESLSPHLGPRILREVECATLGA